MNKIILVLGGLLLTSCGALEGSLHRARMGNSEKSLLKTVSIEQNCPTDKIVVLDKIQTLGHATFSLNVCGKRMVYKQVGSVYLEASQAKGVLK